MPLQIRSNRAREIFQAVEAKWTHCQRCPLHHTRYRVVQARGRLPCQLLFVGEAPGSTEDLLGEPFVGKAGEVLDRWLTDSVPDPISYAIINTVGCKPEITISLPDREETRLRPPELSEIEACSPRFRSLVDAANPTAIVHLGRCAEQVLKVKVRKGEKQPRWVQDNLTLYRGRPVLDLFHPAWVLRQGGIGSEAYHRGRMLLRDFVHQWFRIPS